MSFGRVWEYCKWVGYGVWRAWAYLPIVCKLSWGVNKMVNLQQGSDKLEIQQAESNINLRVGRERQKRFSQKSWNIHWTAWNDEQQLGYVAAEKLTGLYCKDNFRVLWCASEKQGFWKGRIIVRIRLQNDDVLAWCWKGIVHCVWHFSKYYKWRFSELASVGSFYCSLP